MNDAQKPVLPSTLNLKLFNAAGDQIDYTLYDRLKLNNAGGAIEREWFTTGLNDTDPVSANRKTIADTNVRGGRVPEGQAMAVFAMKFIYEAQVVKTEAQRVLQRQWIHSCSVEFLIESKNQYGTWKLSELLGFVDDSQVTAGAAGQAFESSQGDYRGIKKFNLYIPLPRLTSYSVRLNQGIAPDASLDGDFIYCGLVGILNRAG